MTHKLLKHPLRFILLILLAAALIFIIVFSKPIYRELEYLLGDPTQAEQTVKAFARAHKIPYSAYPTTIIELLERNPETEEFVLHYPYQNQAEADIDLSAYAGSEEVPLFMQWDRRWGYTKYGSDVAGITGCGPLCLSMAAFYLTEDDAYAPPKMLQFAEDGGYYSWGNGTSWTLISEGGKELGFQVTELPLVKSKIIKNLQAGLPIICVMGPGDFTTSGHYIVLTGCEGEMLKVNDPNSYTNSEKLWSYEQIANQIRNLWVLDTQ